MPKIIVIEGTYDVSAICGQAFAKLFNSPTYENNVQWIQRMEEEPIGLESERSKALMRSIHRYEFDAHLKRRIQESKPDTLFILSHLYDVGFWRRASESGIVPDIVFYVEGKPPTEDIKHAYFFKFMHAMDIHNIVCVPNDVVGAEKIVASALDLVYAQVANV